MEGQTKPILLFCLLLDLMAVVGSLSLIILVVINLPSGEDFDNLLQPSKGVLVALRTSLVVGLILLGMYLAVSIICLSYSLSLFLPAWSIPSCLVYMKKVAMTEYITSTCPPKKKGVESIKLSDMIDIN